MKITSRILFILLAFVLSVSSLCGQDNLQNIFYPQYNNPAYNAFKDYYSANVLIRNQWSNVVEGAPKMYGLNFFSPIKNRLGIALQVVDEEAGLHSQLSFTGLFSHYVQLTDNSYLGFGYGVGLEQYSYDIDAIYDDNSDIIDDSGELENELSARTTVGLMYYLPFLYSGISFNTTLNDEYSGYKVLSGFDFFLGAMYKSDNNFDVLLKPELMLKYFKARKSIEEVESWVAPIVDLGLGAFFFDGRVGIGVAQRFGYTQRYWFSLYATSTLNIEYSFERGIGDGYNKNNSHLVKLSWNFGNRKTTDKSNEEISGQLQSNPVISNFYR